MKALRIHGPTLIYEDAPPPSPTPTSPILIRIGACSLTRSETTWPSVTSRNLPIPGHAISGTVVSILASDKSSILQPGDQVYGLLSFAGDGGAAEFALADSIHVALKPSRVSHVEAASIPLSALTALQALFVHSGVVKDPASLTKGSLAGKRILVTGAAGGVGVFGVQLARWAGAEVVALCSVRHGNVEFVKEQGADLVLDSKSDWAGTLKSEGKVIDLVLDCTGAEVLQKCFGDGVVRSGGAIVSVAEPAPNDLIVEARKRSVLGTYFIVEPDEKQLESIAGLVDSGDVRGVVGDVFGLEEGDKAMRIVEEGKTRGKIILRVGDEE